MDDDCIDFDLRRTEQRRDAGRADRRREGDRREGDRYSNGGRGPGVSVRLI